MKIAVIHPWLKAGGSEARALWSAQALKNEHSISLVTSKLENMEVLNTRYGTDVTENDIQIIQTGIPAWLDEKPYGDALRGAYFQRSLKQLASQFDLVISAYNLVFVDVPSIQFIADFSWDDEERRRFHPEKGWKGFIHGKNPMRLLYLAAVNKLAGGIAANQVLERSWRVISNSHFSARILEARYGVKSDVIYPPVAGEFPQIPWNKRKNRFIALGRISPEKELEKVVNILENVRSKGHDVGLDILGNWETSQYGRQFNAWARSKGDWIVFHGDCRGEKKERILAETRYGLHGCNGETFGIAVAEMVKAGCLVFVPDEGGPAEIVDEEMLTYSSVQQGVEKICHLLSRLLAQNRTVKKLANQGRRFSQQTFMEEVRRLVSLYEIQHETNGIQEDTNGR